MRGTIAKREETVERKKERRKALASDGVNLQ